jgi:hypothetical protein
MTICRFADYSMTSNKLQAIFGVGREKAAVASLLDIISQPGFEATVMPHT